MRHRELFVKLGRPPLKEFLAHRLVRPLPGFGLCSVDACHRHRANGSNLCCPPHWVRWKEAQARGVDFEQWCRTEPGTSETTAVSLRGLPVLVTAEVLYALQARTDAEVKSPPILLRGIVQHLREQRVEQFDGVQVRRNTHLAGTAIAMRRTLAAAISTPELEQIKDVWNMAAFGLGQWRRLDFTPLHQEWMRRACKTWVLDEIPRRYGKNIPNRLSEMILCLRFLSQSMVRSREDRGETMAALGRSDIEAFTPYVAHLEHTGEVSSFRRTTVFWFTGRFLREIRDMGLTAPASSSPICPMTSRCAGTACRRSSPRRDRAGPCRGRSSPSSASGCRPWTRSATAARTCATRSRSSSIPDGVPKRDRLLALGLPGDG
ncbi:hypothetical protein AB0L59_26330 [Streptomyces sp. NPDC052109]|uniref:hypothetical protein n=1 Tax=Streptomyces sp. NPDC052109 TaxID=3155527 RepID=UPI003420FB71